MQGAGGTGSVRIKAPKGVLLGAYELDAVVVQRDRDGALELRLELGQGLDIFLGAPKRPGGPLRLLHVDSAVAFVDEITVEADPFEFDLEPLTLDGSGGALGDGVTLRGVTLAARRRPASYRWEIVLERPAGPETVIQSGPTD